MHPLPKLVVGKRSGEILPNSTWKVRTERTQPLVVWPLVLIVGPLADEEGEFLEWLASHGLTRFATQITKVACDLDDIAVLTDEEIGSVKFPTPAKARIWRNAIACLREAKVLSVVPR